MKARLCLIFFFVQLITAMEIEISITNQELTLKDNDEIVRIYKLSLIHISEPTRP